MSPSHSSRSFMEDASSACISGQWVEKKKDREWEGGGGGEGGTDGERGRERDGEAEREGGRVRVGESESAPIGCPLTTLSQEILRREGTNNEETRDRTGRSL